MTATPTGAASFPGLVMGHVLRSICPPQQEPKTVMFHTWAGVNLAFDVNIEKGQPETIASPGYPVEVSINNVRINGRWVDAEDFLGSDTVIKISGRFAQLYEEELSK
jgi:hypothetical protein